MNRIVFSFVFSFVLVACGDDSSTNPGNIADSTVADTEDATSPHEDATPDVEDVGTPGASADAGKADECKSDEDCVAPVECAEARCIPGTKGNVCMVFARLQPQNFCDDSDPCTIDTCATEPKTASDYADFGCSHKQRACDDGNPCTQNLCDAAVEGGCVFVTDANVCNDNNACTQDSCLPGGNCEHVLVSCDDGIASTEDGCTAAGGCFNNPSECAGDAQCGDNDPCTVDFCNADQVCIHQPMICDDGIDCTNDVCFGGVCMAISNCLGGDACNELACNVLSGFCEAMGIEKPDGKECTADACDPVNGWSYPKIDGCCVKDSDCELGDDCIIPICDTTLNVCANVPLLVDDGIACTIDSCELGGYIQNKADDSLCAGASGKPHCSNELGCVECSEYAHCADGDACTDEVCEWKTGVCTKKPHCSDPQVCVDEGQYAYCANPEGWCTSDNQCNPKGACHTGKCVSNFCEYTPIVCDDGNGCSIDTCNPNFGCDFEWKDCNDDDPCTNFIGCDKNTGECKFVKDAYCVQCKLDQECTPGPVCFGNSVIEYTGICNQGQCDHGYLQVCNGSACYTGSCQDGACIQKVKTCDDGDACTKDLCGYQEGCYGVEIDCDDYNPCTVDSCDPAKTCPEGVDFCDATSGCSNNWDYVGCPWGPEGNPCGDLWDCAPCKFTACTDYPGTSDLCIGPPNYVCVHGVTGLFGGIGVKNMGTVDFVLDLKPNNGGPTMNLILATGDHLYYLDATSVEIYSVMDGKNNYDLGFPAGLACLDVNGNLVVGKVVYGTLICD